MSDELEYVLLDPSFAYLDRFVAEQATIALGWSNPGVTQVTIPDDHRVIGKLADGCRLQVRYRDQVITEGQIWAQDADGQAVIDPISGKTRSTGTITLSMLDDADLINAIEGWPKPAAALSAQTDANARYTGPVETVLKSVLSDNLTRLGLSWTIIPSIGMGTSLTVDFRFDKIGDKLLSQLEADMLGLVITRVGSSFRVDVKQGDVFPRPITVESGVIAHWKWNKRRPTATRMVDGGTSSGTSRDFAEAVDSTLEASWGIREGFTDQSSADTHTILAGWAARDLALAGPSAGLQLDLVEQPSWFSFDPSGATGYSLGKRLQVSLPGATFDSAISTVTLTDSPSDGLLIAPTVGEFYAPRARMYRSVQGLVRGIRKLERR